jgi:hypothetical protein
MNNVCTYFFLLRVGDAAENSVVPFKPKEINRGGENKAC